MHLKGLLMKSSVFDCPSEQCVACATNLTPSLDATEPVASPQRGRCVRCDSLRFHVGREKHTGMVQSAVSNTIHEVTEAIIISVAARAARRKLVDFPPTPWLPRMRQRRRLRYSATSQAC